MAFLIVLLLVASGVAIYGGRATLLGSLPIFALGLALGEADVAISLVHGLAHLVASFVTLVGGLLK